MNRESFIISCLRRLREYGEGMVLADQSISSLKEVAKSNVYTIICLSQSSQKDRREVMSVLGLNQQQCDATNRLKEGEGIIRLAARYPYPALLRFPFVKPQNITDSEIDRINRNDEVIQAMLSKVRFRKALDSEADKSRTVQKSHGKMDKVKDVLLDIYMRFDIAAHQRAIDLGMTAEASTRAYKYIEKELFVEPIRLNLTGKKGGLSKYYVLTNKGLDVIHKPPFKQSGGTGPMHFFLERYLKKHLSARGFKELMIEKDFCGKRIDLFGKYEELKVGIEICVSTIRTEHFNIQKDMDKCDILLIVCPDAKTKGKLEKHLGKQMLPNPRIRICAVHELFNKTRELISNASR